MSYWKLLSFLGYFSISLLISFLHHLLTSPSRFFDIMHLRRGLVLIQKSSPKKGQGIEHEAEPRVANFCRPGQLVMTWCQRRREGAKRVNFLNALFLGDDLEEVLGISTRQHLWSRHWKNRGLKIFLRMKSGNDEGLFHYLALWANVEFKFWFRLDD